MNLNVRPIQNINIALTGRCNLRCKYCFYADEMTALRDLPTDKWLAFFEELGRLKVMDVTLTGGEVFTRRDLFELIDGVVANRMRYTLLSNGTLIDEKMLAKFEEGKRRLRLNSIQISIDG
jgi:MoaA/NifB/PqqE/SkfB family radical SAM enzyme